MEGCFKPSCQCPVALGGCFKPPGTGRPDMEGCFKPSCRRQSQRWRHKQPEGFWVKWPSQVKGPGEDASNLLGIGRGFPWEDASYLQKGELPKTGPEGEGLPQAVANSHDFRSSGAARCGTHVCCKVRYPPQQWRQHGCCQRGLGVSRSIRCLLRQRSTSSSTPGSTSERLSASGV